MPRTSKGPLRKKYGAVVLLDALGAATFSELKIRQFLSARGEIHSFVHNFASDFGGGRKGPLRIFTFGDTIILTLEMKLKEEAKLGTAILGLFMVIRRYLYHSLRKGLLFRGALSMGSYIEDVKTNTVMGQAVSDAAAWYDKAEWMGVACTPGTKNVLEYYAGEQEWQTRFCCRYPVPMRDGEVFDLYTIAWPALFFEKDPTAADIGRGKFDFLNIIKDLSVPVGTERKFENTKTYFTFIRSKLENEESETSQ